MNAIIETSMGVAAILLYTAPAIVMIISVILFNEKITYKKTIIVAITFGGLRRRVVIFYNNVSARLSLIRQKMKQHLIEKGGLT